MAYADQQMSNNRIIALIVVALIHIGLGYALVTGLDINAIQKVVERVATVDIKEPEEEPEDEPPPPPEEVPETIPPPYVPPPAMPPLTQQPPQKSTPDIPDNLDNSRKPNKVCSDGSTVAADAACPPPGPATKTCPDGKVIPQNAVCPPPPPPPPPPANKVPPKAVQPKGSPSRWFSDRDYPSRALREEREGVTRFRVDIGADGKVTNCSVTGSSGHSDLDDATCKLISRRGRFNPATDGNGNKVSSSWSSSWRWVIPK